MPYLTIQNLNKSYGENKVLTDVSVAVEKGEFVTLLGPSGCGKTTVLRIISGLLAPDSGAVLIGGEDMTQTPAEKRNIGMVFQNYALFPTMSVYQNIAYGLSVRKRPKAEIDERVSAALKLVKLEGLGSRKVTKLSGGQQQRVALARALIIEPSLLLLDEPLSALDRKVRAEMQGELSAIQQKVGVTTVFVTHDQEEALTLSDRIILMKDGRIEQEADPYTLYTRPNSAFASDFLGKANLLKGVLRRFGGEWKIEGNGWAFPVNYAGGQDGDAVRLAVRGEHFAIDKAPFGGAERFKVKRRVFTGTVCRLFGTLGGDDTPGGDGSPDGDGSPGGDEIEVAVISPDMGKYEIGNTVYVRPAEEAMLYFLE